MNDVTIHDIASLVSGDMGETEASLLRDRIAARPEWRAALEEMERLAAFLRAEHGATPSPGALEQAKRSLRLSRPGLVDRVAEGVRTILASLDFDSRLSPAIAGFRGVADVAQVAFSAEPCELDLEIHPGHADSSMLRGQIAAEDSDGWVLGFVRAGGEEPARVEAAADGSFKIELPNGSYTIVLERGDVRVEAGPLNLP
ncbi:MAG: hypothetical protein H6810_07420 [Phycisphaeraceae bacterium]|nr:MAG: hypothetical protein H6810_07420 [Phycisphaeraceae bacterium]